MPFSPIDPDTDSPEREPTEAAPFTPRIRGIEDLLGDAARPEMLAEPLEAATEPPESTAEPTENTVSFEDTVSPEITAELPPDDAELSEPGPRLESAAIEAASLEPAQPSEDAPAPSAAEGPDDTVASDPVDPGSNESDPIEVENTGAEPIAAASIPADPTFADLGLHPGLVDLLTEGGYDAPTPVQAQAIPALLAGRDVIAQAQTGTGKTAAFSLPMVQTLDITLRAVQGLVLCPTRELALQVTDSLERYGASRGVRALTVYGGTPIHRQISALRRGVHVVVGTPGRVLDCIRRGALSLDTVDQVVLDEADEMLRMGFIDDVETILAEVPKPRRTALLSATMPPAIRRVAESQLEDPVHVKIDPDTRTVAEIEQRVLVVHHSEKVDALCRLIEAEDTGAVLVFARTRASCGQLVDTLRERGVVGAALHGDLNQDAREEIVERLRARRIDLVVATDIAARGLDVEGITHVINFDPPDEPETYVHRIGRTGRAGRKGVSILLVTPRERRVQRAIESYLGEPLARTEVPTNEQLRQGRIERFTRQVREQLEAGNLAEHRSVIEGLLEDGSVDPIDLAAALARLATKERPLRIETQEPRPATRRDFERRQDRGGAPWDGGRRDGGRRDSEQRGASDRGARDRDGGSRGRRDEGFDRGDRFGGPPPRDRRSDGPEAGYRRLFLPVGHFAGLRPGDLVGAIANESGIPGSSIGAIDIREKVTFVDVRAEVSETVLERMRHVVIRGRKTTLSVAREGSWERRPRFSDRSRGDRRPPGRGPRPHR